MVRAPRKWEERGTERRCSKDVEKRDVQGDEEGTDGLEIGKGAWERDV